LDRRDVKGPFRLPKEPEFLFIEEAAAHRRSWSENLTYYTGVGYLAGAVLGGGMGAYRAITTPVTLATAEGLPSQRLRINQLLNTSGKLGRSAGNALGVVGLMFSSSESFLRHMNDGALPEDMATVGAGTLTGAIYRSARGPRQAVAAAAVGTFAAAGLLAARNFINSGL
jgi:import inner membrane translocase subunit TIM23